ncbi:MAG: ABC transporter permease [Woeseiaceae bacterium]
MKTLLAGVLYPLTTVALVLFLWYLATDVYQVPSYILPSIDQVLEALKRGYVDGEYWEHLAFTLRAMVLGYLAGVAVAMILGVLVAEIRVVERMIFPVVIALQSMPKVALAPLVIVWFGFGIESKIVLVALICFFPIFINVIAGLRSVDSNLVDMMRAFGAPAPRILFEVKLPHAAPTIFAGLQISVVLGLIGAVVGEFIASTRGLGFLIQASSNLLDLGVVFAALISLAAIGICGTQFVRLVQRRLIFWQRSTDAVTSHEA